MAEDRTCRLIDGIEPLIERYDGFLIDQFGVLHDGVRVLEGAREALLALRRAGATVVVFSNSGKRSAQNRARLAAIGIASELYTTLLTAGEAAWQGLMAGDDPTFAGLGRRCLFFGRGGDRSAIEGLDLVPTADPAAADFVLLSGIDADAEPAAERTRALAGALARRLPLVCTNPDLIGLDGERHIDAPGTVARRYAEAGGEVRYVGKPWPAIYRAALATMAMPGERIVAVGDSLEHDIEGAAGFGIDGALILDGIHAGTFAGAAGEADLLARLQDLLGGRGQAPRWLLRALRLGGGQPPVRR